MDKHNFRTLLVKAAGLLSVASLSVLISLPGLSQQSPDNTSPTVPSTVKPTNPGGRDAGTTNGGEDLNRVPSSGSTMQRNNSTEMQQNNSTRQPAGTGADNADPTSKPDPVNRVEGRDQGTQGRPNNSPSGNYSQPGTNQPGATTGGDSSQQVDQTQNGGSTMQQNQSTPRQSPQSDSGSGSSTNSTSKTQQQSGGSVRALW